MRILLKWLIQCCFVVLWAQGVFAQSAEATFLDLRHDVREFYLDQKARTYRHKYEDLIFRLDVFIGRHAESSKIDEALELSFKLKKDLAAITKREEDIKAAAQAEKKIKRQTHGDVFEVKGISVQESDDQLVLELAISGQVGISSGELAAQGQTPRRIFYDVKPAVLGRHIPSQIDLNKRGLFKVRTAQFKPDVVRIVLEVESKTNARIEKNIQKQELAIYVGGPLTLPPVISSPPKNGIKRIVIDPGHGGKDSGAVGKNGLMEKNVTLAIAKRLKATIEKELPGVKVFLTRDSDMTLPLKKRTEMANNLEADLFISVHVNSHHNTKAQGVETYYLDVAHDRYGKRLAARENAMSEDEVSNLEFILADLAMKSNVTDSVRLGKMVQSSVVSKLTTKWRDVKDLGLKHALFYVLLGAKMPAILIETSFISNREEEKRLRLADYQDNIAAGVVKGIRRFAEEKQAMFVP